MRLKSQRYPNREKPLPSIGLEPATLVLIGDPIFFFFFFFFFKKKKKKFFYLYGAGDVTRRQGPAGDARLTTTPSLF